MSVFYVGVVVVAAGFVIATLLKPTAAKVFGALLGAVGVSLLVTTHPAIAERSERDEARTRFCKRVAYSLELWDTLRRQKPETRQQDEWMGMRSLLSTAESFCVDDAESCVGLASAPGNGPFDQELPRRLEALVRGDRCK